MDNPVNFRKEVYMLVSSIPEGRLMTYGQIAALAGSPRSARIVGGIAHYGDPVLPWQRVVNRHGYLARGYPGGRKAHKVALEKEGVVIVRQRAPIEKLIWWPEQILPDL
jgi:methylated-DNA-protein-cysteine methyltransferase-like protein